MKYRTFTDKSLLILALILALANVAHADWEFTSHKDEMTDEDNSYVASYGDEGAVFIKCLNGRPRLGVTWDKYFGGDSDNEVMVEMRVDGGTPVREWWSLATGHKLAFGPRDRDTHWANALMNSTSTVIRITDPLDGERITIKLDTSGLTRQLYSRLPCVSGRTSTSTKLGVAL